MIALGNGKLSSACMQAFKVTESYWKFESFKVNNLKKVNGDGMIQKEPLQRNSFTIEIIFPMKDTCTNLGDTCGWIITQNPCE